MIGKTISHYKIIEKLGSGGMGIVYKAQDQKLDRYVALKFLPAHLTSNEEVKQRFIHEAKAASALQHNNICTIHEIDETEDGQLFICMDYYEGETLKNKIEGNQLLSLDEILDIAIQIANGLARAHESNITHRDLKPANIMITNRNEVKIVDFGLAKLAGQTKLTKDGTTLGTIAYMSPEQARGDEVDHRSDIWSLGVILFEILSDQLPFKGDYDQALIYSIINDQPELITTLRSGVPMELERVITKCLHKNVADRFQHVDELIVDLRSLKRESESIGQPRKKRSIKKRSKTLIFSSVILIILILITAGYFFIFEQDKIEMADTTASKWENSIAVLPFADLSPEKDQDYFCDGMTEQIISNLSRIMRLKVISRTSVMKYKDTKKTTPVIGKELNVSYVLEGSIRKFKNRIRVTAQLIDTKDDFHLWSEDYDRKLEDVFEVQDDVSQKIASNLLAKLSSEEKEDLKTNRPSNTKAHENLLKGLHYLRMDEKTDILKSIDYFKQAIEISPTYAIAYTELANAYQRLTGLDFLSKDEGYPKALAAVERALELEPDLNEAHLALARIKFVLEWDWESAEKEFLKVLKQNPNSAKGHERYAVYLVMMGRFEEATQEILLARDLDPLSPWINNNVGWIYYFQRQHEKALAEYQKNLEMYPSFSMSYREQALVYLCLGMIDAAIESGKKAVAVSEGDPLNAADLGYIYAMVGKHEEANMIIEQLLKKSSTKTIQFYQLSSIFGALGDNDKAFEYLEKAYDYHSGWALQIKVDPAMDNLRSDPRYEPFVRKMGLEP